MKSPVGWLWLPSRLMLERSTLREAHVCPAQATHGGKPTLSSLRPPYTQGRCEACVLSRGDILVESWLKDLACRVRTLELRSDLRHLPSKQPEISNLSSHPFPHPKSGCEPAAPSPAGGCEEHMEQCVRGHLAHSKAAIAGRCPSEAVQAAVTRGRSVGARRFFPCTLNTTLLTRMSLYFSPPSQPPFPCGSQRPLLWDRSKEEAGRPRRGGREGVREASFELGKVSVSEVPLRAARNPSVPPGTACSHPPGLPPVPPPPRKTALSCPHPGRPARFSRGCTLSVQLLCGPGSDRVVAAPPGGGCSREEPEEEPLGIGGRHAAESRSL